MTTPCRKCPKPARQEAHRPDHIGFDGHAWRPYCEEHLAQQIGKYPLLIRPVGAPLKSQREHTVADLSGISFSAVPDLKRFIVATTMGALGTVPFVADADNPKPLQNVRIVLPAVAHESTATRYEKLRNEIIASGVPSLDDEELQKEIAGRKRRG